MRHLMTVLVLAALVGCTYDDSATSIPDAEMAAACDYIDCGTGETYEDEYGIECYWECAYDVNTGEPAEIWIYFEVNAESGCYEVVDAGNDPEGCW